MTSTKEGTGGANDTQNYLVLRGGNMPLSYATGGWKTQNPIDISKCDALNYSVRQSTISENGKTHGDSIKWGLQDADTTLQDTYEIKKGSLANGWAGHSISLSDFADNDVDLKEIIAVNHSLIDRTDKIDIDEVYFDGCDGSC